MSYVIPFGSLTISVMESKSPGTAQLAAAALHTQIWGAVR